MKTFMLKIIGLSAFTASLFGVESVALANTHTIRGYFKFVDDSGGYCDSSQGDNCNGARMLASTNGTAQPIRNGRIEVRKESGVLLADCATNDSGYYHCAWSGTAEEYSVRVQFRFEDKERRFKVIPAEGSQYYYWQSSLKTVSRDEDKFIGTITMPRMGIAQIYNMAERMYYDLLVYSARMRADYSGVTLAAYDTACGEDNACANGPARRVRLGNVDHAYASFTVLHELGHLVDYIANPRRRGGTYCYPSTQVPCDGPHSTTSEEWRSKALIEGIATFFAVATTYSQSASEPRQCFHNYGKCGSGPGNFIETTPSCSGKIGRNESQHTRYFWDLHDSNDSVNANFYNIVDSIYDTPDGYNVYQKESGFASSASGDLDNLDSFSSWEWNQRFETSENYSNADAPYFWNCLGYF